MRLFFHAEGNCILANIFDSTTHVIPHVFSIAREVPICNMLILLFFCDTEHMNERHFTSAQGIFDNDTLIP